MGIPLGHSTPQSNAADTADLLAGELTVRDLRRRWKPLKEGEAAAEKHKPVRIRLHRAFSWMQRVQDLAEATADADNARLVYYWFGFNTLYGSWDSENREPLPDRGALRVFTKSLSEHDHDGLMPAIMREHQKLAESIVGDEYLNRAGAMRFNAAVAEHLDRFRNEPPAPEENLVQK